MLLRRRYGAIALFDASILLSAHTRWRCSYIIRYCHGEETARRYVANTRLLIVVTYARYVMARRSLPFTIKCDAGKMLVRYAIFVLYYAAVAHGAPRVEFAALL